MSKYPEQSCRNCAHATWRWSNKKYADGKHRIIVQDKARCKADPKVSAVESRWEKIDAREPHTDCISWEFHGDAEKAAR